MRRHSVHPGRLRTLLAAGAVVAVLAAAPAVAQAASVSEASAKLNYVAGPGEANHVTIVPWGFYFKVTETGTKNGAAIALSVGPGCWRLSSSAASCGLAVSGITFDGGDGDDFLDASKLWTAVTATGGAGDDALSTGAGADTLDGGDGTDTISCGGGTDADNADALDVVAADCENVTRPEPPTDPGEPGSTDPGSTDPGSTDPGSTDPGTDPVPPGANAVPPTIPPQAVSISLTGVATVVVVCPLESGGCRGVVTITIPGAASRRHAKPVAASKRKTPALKVGSAKFKAAAGSAKRVPVRLSKRGRQRILRGRTRRARITVATRSAAGTTTVTTQDVTLRPRPRPKDREARRR